MTSRSNHSWVCISLRWGLLAALVAILHSASAVAAEDVVLVSVNGEDITSADLDRLIMEMHSSSDMDTSDNSVLERFFNKAINDKLILQEARSMELDQDPRILDEVAKETERKAVELFARENFETPPAPTDEEVEQRFEDLYWKIQLRQITVRTSERAQQLKFMIREGSPMDSLAAEFSLDTRRFKGGQAGPLFWADVEEVLRAQVRGVEENVLVGPFPYQEAFTILRVEERYNPDPADLEKVEAKLRSDLTWMAREKAWEEFVEQYRGQTSFERDETVFADIAADSAKVFDDSFSIQNDRPAIWVGDISRTEGDVRAVISRRAAEMGTSSWSEILKESLSQIEGRLALADQARKAGMFEREKIRRGREELLEDRLISAYLNRTIVPAVKFDREEFDQFYRDNLELFRDSNEVRLDVMVFDDRATADEARALLADGASFDFVREKFLGIEAKSVGNTKWAKASLFSQEVQNALADLPINGFTPVLPSSSRWMIMELEGRREGQVKPIEEVEMQIREVMFQKEFNELLDERLALLKERSEIVHHDERIIEYFQPADAQDGTSTSRSGQGS